MNIYRSIKVQTEEVYGCILQNQKLISKKFNHQKLLSKNTCLKFLLCKHFIVKQIKPLKYMTYAVTVLRFPKNMYLSRNTIDMKLHHVFTTWIVFWFSFLILRVNYTVNRKKKKEKEEIMT